MTDDEVKDHKVVQYLLHVAIDWEGNTMYPKKERRRATEAFRHAAEIVRPVISNLEAENERLMRVLRSIRDSAPGSDARPLASDALEREEVRT